MPLAELSVAWIRAEAALPLGWALAGVALGPTHDARDPMVIFDEHWVAWATSLDGDRCEGSGSTPHLALDDLARHLAEMRGNLGG